MPRHSRLSSLLTVGYVMFIVYASLSPFSGWQEQGITFGEVLRLPWRITYSLFDALVNFVCYIPLGVLLGLALRPHLPVVMTAGFAILLSGALSAGMEYAQMYLPIRISSNVDILTNTAGAALGAMLAITLTAWTDWHIRLVAWRNQWFYPSDFGLALLCLWVFGQTNPSLPMLGNLFINDVADQPFVATVSIPFSPLASFTVLLNLLMLGFLLLTLLCHAPHILRTLSGVLGSVALIKFIIASVLLKSSALLVWINAEAVLGITVGVILLRLAVHLPRPWLHILGVITALGYFILINLTSNGPSLGATIYQWNSGHLRNYNGLAQTIAHIFPLLLLFHLARRRN